jgi:hypothetical protein
MVEILTGSFAPRRWEFWPASCLRAVNWNIERGLRLAEIVDFLASQNADLLIFAGGRSKCGEPSGSISRRRSRAGFR